MYFGLFNIDSPRSFRMLDTPLVMDGTLNTNSNIHRRRISQSRGGLAPPTFLENNENSTPMLTYQHM